MNLLKPNVCEARAVMLRLKSLRTAEAASTLDFVSGEKP